MKINATNDRNKGKNEISCLICKISLLIMVRVSRQMINEEREDMNNAIGQMDHTDIHRILY